MAGLEAEANAEQELGIALIRLSAVTVLRGLGNVVPHPRNTKVEIADDIVGGAGLHTVRVSASLLVGNEGPVIKPEIDVIEKEEG